MPGEWPVASVEASDAVVAAGVQAAVWCVQRATAALEGRTDLPAACLRLEFRDALAVLNNASRALPQRGVERCQRERDEARARDRSRSPGRGPASGSSRD